MKKENTLCHVTVATAVRKGARSKRIASEDAFIDSINELISAQDHDTVIDLVTNELYADPRNHALMLLLGNTYLSEGDMQTSLTYHLRAIETHECVHTIWHLAHHMKYVGAVKDAIALWKSVIEIGACEDNPSAASRCKRRCRVMDDRASVVANARFMVSLSYLETGRVRLSQHYKHSYMHDLASGVKGMCPPDAPDTAAEVRVLRHITSTIHTK